MATEVIMPKLGMGMTEGTVVKWLKEVGDPVRKGEPVVVISSDKIETEVESPADGILLEITAPAEQVVPCGQVIGMIGVAEEKFQRESQPPAVPLPGAISPVARKMAEAAGIPLETLKGTGPHGRITKADVERALAERQTASSATAENETGQLAAKEAPSPLSDAEVIPFSPMRRVIANRMWQSLQQSAQVTLTLQADVTELMQVKGQLSRQAEERFGHKLTLTAFIARAVVLALQKHKGINSSYRDEGIYTYRSIHLGIAVALEQGLVVPVIRQAETCSLLKLSLAIQSLSERARQGLLTNEEMSGSTFTITNLGQYGIEYFTPVLNPPEAGILGVGALQDRPVFNEGAWLRRILLPLSLTFDHRVLDGAPAAAFLAEVRALLEQPYSLLL